MAKLYLTFEGRPLKEFTLSHGAVTIGRLPDNLVQIDNLAVSGHHAKVSWSFERYVLEDLGSTNGTYVNEQRVGKHELVDGDKILIGKHTLEFADEWHEDEPADEKTQVTAPVPQMHATVMLDTKKAKELLAQAKASAGAVAQTEAAAAAAPQPAEAAAAGPTGTVMTPAPQIPAKDRVGTLTVIDGKTDQKQYTLTGKLTVIGKSDMATIKLKGWFAPNVAAIITRRDTGYQIASQDKGAKVKVSGADVPSGGHHDLAEGDTVEVSGVKMTFTLEG
ncbi:MAG TPA: FHA domain-containing protein [Terriglobales bacterium]|nr:FHA domain-containing protein [Terriglobales bacterium]